MSTWRRIPLDIAQELQQEDLTLGEVMNQRIVRLDGSMPVTRAAKLMVTHGVGSVIVDDGSDEGIITKGDIISRVIAFGHDPGIVSVGEIASKPLIKIDQNQTLEDAMILMARNKIERLVVIDKFSGEDNKIVGVIGVNDILRAAPGLFEIKREALLLASEHNEEEIESFMGYCDECSNYSTELKSVGGYALCPECLGIHQESDETDESDETY